MQHFPRRTSPASSFTKLGGVHNVTNVCGKIRRINDCTEASLTTGAKMASRVGFSDFASSYRRRTMQSRRVLRSVNSRSSNAHFCGSSMNSTDSAHIVWSYGLVDSAVTLTGRTIDGLLLVRLWGYIRMSRHTESLWGIKLHRMSMNTQSCLRHVVLY